MSHGIGRPVLIALLLVAATALVAVAATAAASPDAGALDVPAAQTNASNASDSVNVSVGAQLSTVIETRSQEVRMDVENADFRFEFESGDPGEAVAERAAELREAATEVREDYRELTAEYEAGEITRDEFAQRIATLNDRAERIRASLEDLRSRTDRLTDEDIADARFNETEVREIARDLENVSGAGPEALLKRFTGQSTGEVELGLDGGLRIEVESEDGERSREIRRAGDDSLNLTISQDEALQTARERLSTDAGNWTLVEATVHEEDGEYRFEFALRTATLTGETEVRVDGSSGDVVRLEEELEPRDVDDDDEREEDDETPEPTETPEDDETDTPEPTETPEATDTPEPTETPEPEMDIAVTNGTAGPGETITIQVTIGGDAAADVPVEVEGDMVGRTAADGTLTVTLPDADEVRIRAETDEHDAERRFDFEDT